MPSYHESAKNVLILALFSCILPFVLGGLVGEHVCEETEVYSVNVTEYFIKNATVRKYEWCLNVPPRCSYYIIKPINATRMVERNRTRNVEKCCSGFIQNDNHCILKCPDCVQGGCVAGQCVCHPGFAGVLCDKNCPENRWGSNCVNECSCVGGKCESVAGLCDCPAGWQGQRCDTPCDQNYFGKNCQEFCECEESCDPVTGICFPSTNHTKENETIIFTNNGKPDIIKLSDLESNESISTKFSIETPINPTPYNGYTAVNGTSVMIAFLIIAGLLAVTLMANHYRKKQKTGKNEEKHYECHGNDTMTPDLAYFTQSIFHTPLPEPPPKELFCDGQKFETHVVCNVNFSNVKGTDHYDHPPPTNNDKIIQVSELSEEPTMEPVYDEIHSRAIPVNVIQSSSSQTYKSPALYMNTFGKTRL